MPGKTPHRRVGLFRFGLRFYGKASTVQNFSEKMSFIWSVADLLRSPYRPNQYKDVMLPMTVLRRLDCVLEPTKDKILDKLKSLRGGKELQAA